jgi:Icc-related predicted phosphoesterase
MERQPALWFHGHMHDAKDYNIGSTRVVINPRGYGNQHKTNNYDPTLVVEI